MSEDEDGLLEAGAMQAYAPDRLYVDGGLSRHKVVLVADGRIASICEAGVVPYGLQVLALDGLLAPGYVELQINGCSGVIFNEGLSLGAVATMAKTCREHGVTSFLPTLITAADADIDAAFAIVERAIHEVPGVVGMHLEGPNLSVERRGTHPADLVRQLTDARLERVLDAAARGVLRLFTIAPESVTFPQMRRMASAGLTLSVGHTAASAEDVLEAEACGVRMLTHLFNGMPPMGGRAPGAVGAAFASDRLMASIIVDHAHVSAISVKAAYRALGDRLFLVSDASASPDMGGQTFRFGGYTCHIENGVVRNHTGGIAGAAMLLDQIVANAAALLGDVGRALFMATEMPARMINKDDEIGVLAKGRRANFNLLDPSTLAVKRVWADGKEIRPERGGRAELRCS